jgi:hypothetical protein
MDPSKDDCVIIIGIKEAPPHYQTHYIQISFTDTRKANYPFSNSNLLLTIFFLPQSISYFHGIDQEKS